MRFNRKYVTSMIGITMLALFAACGPADDAPITETPGITEIPAATATISPTEEPTPTVTPTATVCPTVTEVSVAVTEIPVEETLTETPTQTPTPTATPTPAVTPDDFTASDFFQDALFAGDSVMSHFYWRVPYYDKENFGGSTFIAAPSYSLREALNPESELHPMYRGESKPIWENMKLITPARVFLFFGLNDIGISGVDKFLQNYDAMVAKIKETDPEVKVYILSITPMRADSEKKLLNNANITESNKRIQAFCEEKGLGYIDVATMFLDDTGALKTEYSDGTNVHLTKEAYQLWKEVLVRYAKEQLMAEYYESIAE